jgi:hypothetical protein
MSIMDIKKLIRALLQEDNGKGIRLVSGRRGERFINLRGRDS